MAGGVNLHLGRILTMNNIIFIYAISALLMAHALIELGVL